jgi:hypothetical protein
MRRDLLWLTLAAAVFCGWFLHVRSLRITEENRAEEQRQHAESAMNEIKELVAKARQRGVPLPATPGEFGKP